MNFSEPASHAHRRFNPTTRAMGTGSGQFTCEVQRAIPTFPLAAELHAVRAPHRPAPRLIAAGVGKLRNDLLELGEDRGSLAERHGDTELVSTMLQRRPGDLYTSVQAIFSQALGRTRSSG
jgi:hypothetical protein